MRLKTTNITPYFRNKNVLFERNKLQSRVTIFMAQILNSISLSNKVVFSERVIEYPIIFQHLDKNCEHILDFGCVEDLLPIHLASLGYNVTGLDFREYPFSHQNFKFIRADILNWEPPEERYDCAISVSTIEHVGLGAYGDPVCEGGDKTAVAKLFVSLKRGGQLLITVPFGKATIKRGMRIYNYDGLCELVPNIETARFFFKSGRYENWLETKWSEINNLEYADYSTISPVQAVAFVVARKD